MTAAGSATVTAAGTVTKSGLAETLYDVFVAVGQAVGEQLQPNFPGIPEGPAGYRIKSVFCELATRLAGAILPVGWQDLTVDAVASRVGGTAPTFKAFVGGIYGHAFSAASVDELHIPSFHVKHDAVNGEQVYMHVHWSPATNAAGTVRWGFEFSCAKGYGLGAFTSTTTIYVEQDTNGVVRDHLIAESVAQTIAGWETDALVKMRVFRDGSHANDDYPDEAFLHTVDFHYLSDHRVTSDRNRESGWDPLP